MDVLSKQVKKFKLVFQNEEPGLQMKIVDEKNINHGIQLKISDGKDIVTVNIYHGKKGVSFVIQGSQTPLKDAVENIVGYGGVRLTEEIRIKNHIQEEVEVLNKPPKPINGEIVQDIPWGFENIAGFDGKWIGIDESGKGDFFGPLVAAAVMLDRHSAAKLETLGVKDCKMLSEKKNSVLAAQIKEECQGRYVEFVLSPKEYNLFYGEYEKKGLNLNNLLGYAHAKVLEELLEKEPCKFALADKFGAEKFTKNQLLDKGKKISLVQIPRGEENIAVAAASILARQSFLESLRKMRENFGLPFPKGAVNVLNTAREFAEKHGEMSLSLVCKTHFRIYKQIFAD